MRVLTVLSTFSTFCIPKTSTFRTVGARTTALGSTLSTPGRVSTFTGFDHHCVEKALDRVCRNLAARSTEALVASVRCPRQPYEEVLDSGLLQPLVQPGALIGRNQVVVH